MNRIKLLAFISIGFGFLMAALLYTASVINQPLVMYLAIQPTLQFIFALFVFFQLDAGKIRKSIPKLFPQGLAILFLSKFVSATTLYVLYKVIESSLSETWQTLITRTSARMIGIVAMALILHQIINRNRKNHDEEVILDQHM